jgi:hypothetical protein
MTIITPTGVTGINSITSSGNSLSFQNASGASIDVSGLKVAADSMNVSGIVTASGIVVSAGSTSAPSISPSVDSNTGIFFPSPDTIAFGEGGTEAFRVDSSGRLGIGTNNPSTEFEVFGTGTVAFFRGTGGSGFIGIKDEDDGTLGFIGVDGGSIKLQTSGNSYADKLVVDSSGRVTMPYQPAFHMENSANNSVWKGGTVHVNTGNHWNNTDGIFTAPIAGVYLFELHGQAAGGGFWYAGITVNGVGKASWYTDETSGYRHASCTLIISLSVNDQVQGTKLSSSVSLNTGGQNGFCGHLIG